MIILYHILLHKVLHLVCVVYNFKVVDKAKKSYQETLQCQRIGLLAFTLTLLFANLMYIIQNIYPKCRFILKLNCLKCTSAVIVCVKIVKFVM